MQESEFKKILDACPEIPSLKKDLRETFERNKDDEDDEDDQELGRALAHKTKLWIQYVRFMLIITFGFYALFYAAKHRGEKKRNVFTSIKEAEKFKYQCENLKANKAELLYTGTLRRDPLKLIEDEASYDSTSDDFPTALAFRKLAAQNKIIGKKQIELENRVRACYPMQNGNYFLQQFDNTMQIITPQKEVIFSYIESPTTQVTCFLETEEFIFVSTTCSVTNANMTLRFNKKNLEEKPYYMIHGPALSLSEFGGYLYVAVGQQQHEVSKVVIFEQSMRAGTTKTHLVDNPHAENSSEEIIEVVEYINSKEGDSNSRQIPEYVSHIIQHVGNIEAISSGVFAISTLNSRIDVYNLDISPNSIYFLTYPLNHITHTTKNKADIIAGTSHGHILVYHIEQAEYDDIDLKDNSPITHLTVAADHRHLAACNESGTVFIIDLKNHKIKHLLPLNRAATNIAFNSRNELACTIAANVEEEIPNETPVDCIVVLQLPALRDLSDTNYRKRLTFKDETKVHKQLKNSHFIISKNNNTLEIIDKHGNQIRELKTISKIITEEDGSRKIEIQNIPIVFSHFVEMEDGTIIGYGKKVENNTTALFLWRQHDNQFVELNEIGDIVSMDIIDNFVIITTNAVIAALEINESSITSSFKLRSVQESKIYAISEGDLVENQFSLPDNTQKSLRISNGIIIATTNNTAMKININSGRCKKESMQIEQIAHLEKSPSGNYFVLADDNGNIFVLSSKSLKHRAYYKTNQALSKIFVNDEGKVCAAISDMNNPEKTSHIEFFRKSLDPESHQANENTEVTLDM